MLVDFRLNQFITEYGSMGREAGASFGLQPRDYSVLPAKSSCKIDEGYSDETKSVQENESVQDSLELPAWILARSEADRAGIAPARSFIYTTHNDCAFN